MGNHTPRHDTSSHAMMKHRLMARKIGKAKPARDSRGKAAGEIHVDRHVASIRRIVVTLAPARRLTTIICVPCFNFDVSSLTLMAVMFDFCELWYIR